MTPPLLAGKVLCDNEATHPETGSKLGFREEMSVPLTIPFPLHSAVRVQLAGDLIPQVLTEAVILG